MCCIDIFYVIAFLSGLLIAVGKWTAIMLRTTEFNCVLALWRHITADLTLHRPCSAFRANRQILFALTRY